MESAEKVRGYSSKPAINIRFKELKVAAKIYFPANSKRAACAALK